MPHPLRGPRLRAAIIVSATVIAALPAGALGAASQTGPTLTITGSANDELYDIDVLPTGSVVVQYAPGVPDGTAFSGVTDVRILSMSGNDTIELDVASSMRFLVDDSRGPNKVLANVTAPASGTLRFGLDAILSTSVDTVEVKAHSLGASLDVDVRADTSTGADEVKVEVNGEGRAAWLRADLWTVGGTSDDSAALVVASDSPSVAVGMDSLTDNALLLVDHKAAGVVNADLNMRGEAFDNVVVAELKGSDSTKVVSGQMFGGFWHDNVTLLTEGPTLGNPLIDGGQGTDSCSATIGSIVNCE